MRPMPNDYSIEIHDFLTQLIRDAELCIYNRDEPDYNRGRLEELLRIRQYLSENIDLKNFTYY